jgi:hypothetical protein
MSGDRIEGTEQTLGDRLRLEDVIRDQRRGRLDTIRTVTLTLSAASTTVTHFGCGQKSVVLLMPTDATTALEYGLGTTWVVPSKGQYVINHPNNATTRTYRVVFFNGATQ